MSPGWDRVKELLGRALELPPEERAAFLDEACGDDGELRAELERLIALEEGAEDFLEPPAEIFGAEPAADAVLGDFEIKRELGRGGMGVVYLARQKALGRDVALKVFVAGLTTTEREVERFHREARSIARLRHPGIVRVIADGSEGATHWFAMEFVPGHDLSKELEIQRGPERPGGEPAYLTRLGDRDHARTVARIGIEVARALHFAHENGIVHRDVKPQNLLVQEDGRILVVDFGIARDESMGALTRTGEVQGTPYYMSPEQARVRTTAVDHRTDVYSLGVVLYELATLRKPFEARTDAELLTKLRDQEPRPLRSWNPAVPRDLETICLKAMRKAPAERYATAADLADDLQRFLDHVAIQARPPGVVERAVRWAKRRRVRVAVAAAVAVTGVATWFTMDRVAAGRRNARLTVEHVGGAEGTVELREIDPVLGGVGEPRLLGRLPLEDLLVSPGYYRIGVRVEDGRLREFARTLAAGASVDVRVAPVPLEVAGDAGMVPIRGGTVAPRDVGVMSVALNFSDVVVEDFLLDETEVSNADYRRFLEATGHRRPDFWEDLEWPDHGDLPVVGVGWIDARTYAEWCGKRLPSYPEWTLAARGGDNRIYPWPDPVPGEWRGNTRVVTTTNRLDNLEQYLASVVSVRSLEEAATTTGLFHMLGNVREYTDSYAAVPINDVNVVAAHERLFEPRRDMRIAAGHAWYAATDDLNLRSPAVVYGLESEFGESTTGFRCAKSIDP